MTTSIGCGIGGRRGRISPGRAGWDTQAGQARSLDMRGGEPTNSSVGRPEDRRSDAERRIARHSY